MERALYDSGMLSEIVDNLLNFERILYRELTVTVPAHGRIQVEAFQSKQGSFNRSGDLPSGIEGYDLLTSLGSNLQFKAQTASLSNEDAIEIVDQNFGFDLKKGITRVTLDLNEPEYYLNVRKKD